MNLLTILKKNNKSEYYNTEKILKEIEKIGNLNAIKIFMIIGARRIGKTDYFLKCAIDNYFYNHKTTHWLRNFDVELKEPEFFSNFLSDAFHLNMFPEDVDTDKIKVDKRGVSYDGDVFIKFQSINTYSNLRGGAHPHCNMIVLDEFIGENRRYPKTPTKALLSMTKTIFSGREDCYVFCLSNYISVSNAYFCGFEVYPEKNKDITTYIDKGILIEKCSGYKCAISSNSPWNNVYKAGNYGDYASESEDELSTLICKKPKGAEPHDYVISIGESFYRCFYHKDKGYYWQKDTLRYGEICYVTDVTLMKRGRLMITSDIVNLIKYSFESGYVKFHDANTLFAILNITYTV